MTKLQDIIVKEMKVKKRLMKQKKLKVLSHLLKIMYYHIHSSKV